MDCTTTKLDLWRQLSAVGATVVVCAATLGWTPLLGACASPGSMLIALIAFFWPDSDTDWAFEIQFLNPKCSRSPKFCCSIIPMSTERDWGGFEAGKAQYI